MRRANPLSTESYRLLTIRNLGIISETGNRPESLIRQDRRRVVSQRNIGNKPFKLYPSIRIYRFTDVLAAYRAQRVGRA